MFYSTGQRQGIYTTLTSGETVVPTKYRMSINYVKS